MKHRFYVLYAPITHKITVPLLFFLCSFIELILQLIIITHARTETVTVPRLLSPSTGKPSPEMFFMDYF